MNDIRELQPAFYKNIDEFKALANAEDSVIGEFNDNVNKQLMNMFISTSDEQGVAIKEHEYSVTSDSKKSLEDRKTTLKMLLQPPRPITLNYLNYFLRQLNFDVKTKMDYDNSVLYVYIDTGSYTDTQLGRLNNILATYVPANVLTRIYRYEHGNTTLGNYIGIANTVQFHGHSGVQNEGDA